MRFSVADRLSFALTHLSKVLLQALAEFLGVWGATSGQRLVQFLELFLNALRRLQVLASFCQPTNDQRQSGDRRIFWHFLLVHSVLEQPIQKGLHLCQLC